MLVHKRVSLNVESSFQDVLGKQGIGQKTPFQLLFVFNQLWKRIREEYGGNFLSEIWQLTNHELLNNESWKEEAEANFPQSYSNLMNKIDILEKQEDASGIDGLVELLTARPTDLQDPVFSRWMTVLMSCTGQSYILLQLPSNKMHSLTAIYGS